MRKINIKNKLINLALSHSFWVTHFNSGSCSGCDIEILTLFTPRYDLERWGISLRSTPRHTDGLLVTGPLTNQSISHLLRAYSQMPEPRFVFCVGTCACTGGVYQECYNIQTGVDKFIPVALYIPGCPPRPEAIAYGIYKFLHTIRRNSKRVVKKPIVPNLGEHLIKTGLLPLTHRIPSRWTIYVKGNRIVDAYKWFGYNHRGMEKAFEMRTWLQNQYLVSRVEGFFASSHQHAYVLVGEKCANIYDDVSTRAKYIRCITSELERIHEHMLSYGMLTHELGEINFFHTILRDREIVMDVIEKISGNRVTSDIIMLGGVNRDIPLTLAQQVIVLMKKLRKRVEHYLETANRRSHRVRLEGVGYLSYEEALHHSAVGPNLRASGVNHDLRRDVSYDAYDEIPSEVFQVITRNEGDILALSHVYLEETLVSIDIVIWLLENIPEGELRQPWRRHVSPNEAFQCIEAPNGENFHYGRSNGSQKPERYKIRTPIRANLSSTIFRLIGQQIADAPIILSILDPCIGCTEKRMFIDIKKHR